MTRRRVPFFAGLVVAAACQEPPPPVDAVATSRQELLDELRPVPLENCSFGRFGGGGDGGYVMCRNLLAEVEAGYSYGIGTNDDWGCDVSRSYGIPIHQYDCFSFYELNCPGARFVPHRECVGPRSEVVDSRTFDTIANQIARNGDAGRRLVVKLDVEGAEWGSLLATPDAVLERIDQLPMELHGVDGERFLEVVRKLERTFHVAHLHFNNHGCDDALAPFPSVAYQVLLVNKRVGVPGTPPPGALPATHFDAPDRAGGRDCQLPAGTRAATPDAVRR